MFQTYIPLGDISPCERDWVFSCHQAVNAQPLANAMYLYLFGNPSNSMSEQWRKPIYLERMNDPHDAA